MKEYQAMAYHNNGFKLIATSVDPHKNTLQVPCVAPPPSSNPLSLSLHTYIQQMLLVPWLTRGHIISMHAHKAIALTFSETILMHCSKYLVFTFTYPNVVVKFGLKESCTNLPTKLLFPTPMSCGRGVRCVQKYVHIHNTGRYVTLSTVPSVYHAVFGSPEQTLTLPHRSLRLTPMIYT
jgi:hypothetical protein